eukprot:148168-Chlamydomonas_euryale.AAC.1
MWDPAFASCSVEQEQAPQDPYAAADGGDDGHGRCTDGVFAGGDLMDEDGADDVPGKLDGGGTDAGGDDGRAARAARARRVTNDGDARGSARSTAASAARAGRSGRGRGGTGGGAIDDDAVGGLPAGMAASLDGVAAMAPSAVTVPGAAAIVSAAAAAAASAAPAAAAASAPPLLPVDAARARQLSPGKVVWAKVEGHEWWPAQVVRRRAVPREVGAPPGGPPSVMAYIPVVFFNARGIPGEVGERLDTREGILSAAARTLTAAATGGEADEAEFAWLPIDFVKPFHVGDASGSAGAPPASGNTDLLAS